MTKFKDLEGGNKKVDRLKISGGQSVKGVFVGDPVDFRQHWNGKFGEACIGEGCIHCGNGDSPKFRFQINFVYQNEGVWTAKVFEGGVRVYKQLNEINKEYPLESNLIKITRHGDDTDTTWSFLPAGSLDKATLQKVATTPVQDLSQGDLFEESA
jgi:hypothetical protein